MKHSLCNTLLWVALSLVLVPVCGLAQDDEYDSLATAAVKDRKGPSVFHRPTMDSPREQLAYARSLRNEAEPRKAAKQYLALVHEWHESPEAPHAQLAYAQLLLDRAKYRKAFDEFQYLIDQFAGTFPYETALEAQLSIANVVRDQRSMTFGIFPGFGRSERAIPLLEKIIDNAPHWHQTPDARLGVGIIHEEIHNYEEAIAAYEAVEIHHAGTEQALRAAYQKAICLAIRSRKAPRDETICRAALSAFASYRSAATDDDQPGVDEHMKTLRNRLADMYFLRATFYDHKRKEPQPAIMAYEDFLRRFPSADKAVDAKARVDALKKRMGDTRDN